MFFKNDYGMSAHEKVWEALLAHRQTYYPGYGTDEHTRELQTLVRKLCKREDVEVHVVSGGTQANMLVVSHGLRPYEAVIAADSGHINTHETGAVEATGHKIVTMASPEGKLTPEAIVQVMQLHPDEHMVKPAMVYISQTTEVGTVYEKAELQAIRDVCDEYGLTLYIDGARLASALDAVPEVDLPFLAQVADGFTIGGTKNGALFGEAIVLTNRSWQREFRYAIKHRGAMSAKGFVGAIMMKALLEDGVYEAIGHHSNEMAFRIVKGARERNIAFAYPPKSNQIFLQLPPRAADMLAEHTGAELMENLGDQVVIRIVTSFATKEDEVEELLDLLKQLPLNE